MEENAEFKSGESAGKSRRRRSFRKNRVPSVERQRLVESVLRDYIQAVYLKLFGPAFAGSGPFELNLKMEVKPDDRGLELAMNPPLDHQVEQALREMERLTGGYQAGRIFCYRCESGSCEHAEPPHGSCVFGGYSYNGVPQWPELFQLFLDYKDDRVDRLFQPHHEVLAKVIRGRELKQKLLHQFGKASKTYDILSQLVVGYIPISIEHEGKRLVEKVALTIQAVESRGLDGGIRLDLNVISKPSFGGSVLDHLAISEYSKIHEMILETGRKLKEMERTLAKNPGGLDRERKSNLLKRIPSLMNDIADAAEQLYRQRGRRTRHAGERIAVNRPVAAATDDTRHTDEEHILMDEYEKTVVICGPKQRIHIFSLDGKHITSLKLGMDVIQSRIKRKRWRIATKTEIDHFRRQFTAKCDAQEDPRDPE